MKEKDFGFIFWLAVFVLSCICSIDCGHDNRQTYVIRYKDGEQTIPVTVVLDYKKQTEYVINMNPRTPAKSVTLYDFKQRTIAYKDLTNRECFLGRLTHETLSEENHALQDVKNPVEVRPKVRSLDPRMPALTPTEIRNIAGQKTAVFCRKMNTWLLVPEKTHSVSKREVDEYEERTHQYHGHRSSQYSHYERETRRRYRNQKQANFRRRSQRKESEADSENVRQSSAFLPHLNVQSSNGAHFKPERSNNRISNTSNIHQNLRHQNSEIKSLSSDEVLPYSRPVSRHFNLNETGETSYHESIPKFSRNTSDHFKRSSSHAKLTSDGIQDVKERPTNSPSIRFGQVGYPNVHSSLVHLLPLYKPLSQELDFDQDTSTISYADNQQKNIESEDPLLPTALTEPGNTFTRLKAVHNVSQDPDVSINILETPRITKEFENIKDNESYLPFSQSETAKGPQGSEEKYPLLSQKHAESSPYFQRNNIQKESLEHLPRSNLDNAASEGHFREIGFRIPQSEKPTTTRLPVLTTREYPTAERTTLSPLYIPSVHTAFQNSEDFNTFQIFPNYIENATPTSIDRKTSVYSNHATDETTRMPGSLVSTTEHPPIIENRKKDSNHRSDISGEDDKDLSPSLNHVAANAQINPFTSTQNNSIDVNVPPYKLRYQNVLRDFKPDEIVIDIENIPTHTPPPVTSRFYRRPLTTIQPTVKSLPSNNIKSHADRRSEQVLGTTWRGSYPTTRYPRRRISDKSRRPVQNSSTLFTRRNSLSPNRYQAPKPPVRINQLVGTNHFSSSHHPSRRQFQYPSRPIPPSRVIMPAETNQLHHISHLNNLPPGVSVHPRHPQAPFADMVLSNRPPTMPFVDNNQVYMKPHRQRHHRKKERPLNSCCRLRGQAGAFQSCCRNGGGSCCSRSRRRMHPPSSQCCSTSNGIGHPVIPSKQVQLPVRVTNQTLPPIRTEKTHRSEVDNKDRCQKEKMCRTLYESTQQVMVCRNAHVEGC